MYWKCAHSRAAILEGILDGLRADRKIDVAERVGFSDSKHPNIGKYTAKAAELLPGCKHLRKLHLRMGNLTNRDVWLHILFLRIPAAWHSAQVDSVDGSHRAVRPSPDVKAW